MKKAILSNKSRNDSDLQCRRRVSTGNCTSEAGPCVGNTDQRPWRTMDTVQYRLAFVDKKDKVVNKDANGKKADRTQTWC